MPHELAFADDIRHGLTRFTALKTGLYQAHLVGGKRVGIVGNQPTARDSQRMLQQNLRIHPRQAALHQEVAHTMHSWPA